MAGSEISLSMIDFNEGHGKELGDLIDEKVEQDDEAKTSVIKMEVLDEERVNVKK